MPQNARGLVLRCPPCDPYWFLLADRRADPGGAGGGGGAAGIFLAAEKANGEDPGTSGDGRSHAEREGCMMTNTNTNTNMGTGTYTGTNPTPTQRPADSNLRAQVEQK